MMQPIFKREARTFLGIMTTVAMVAPVSCSELDPCEEPGLCASDDDQAEEHGPADASGQPEVHVQQVSAAYELAEAGGDAMASGDWELAMSLFVAAEASPDDAFASWAGSSGRVATARMAAMAGDWSWDVAFATTDEIERSRPELADLLELWNADSTLLSGNMEGALAMYDALVERRLGGVVESTARRQAAILQVELTGEDEPELKGEGGAVGSSLPGEKFGVLPSEADPVLPAACVLNFASDGFQFPFPPNGANWGNRFMTYDSTSYAFDLYHPATDINAVNDCNIDFKPVAQGCVSSAAAVAPMQINSWGSATVAHAYAPATTNTKYWTSSYGHADLIYYSAGAAVTKGSLLGNSGSVEADSCHLHLEIREPDHLEKETADYWLQPTLSSQTQVGKYYEDPEAFITGHPNVLSHFYADEELFTCTGTWTQSTDGDEGDSKWTNPTVSLGTPSAYCQYNFTPGYSATYYVYAHVPWANTSSTNVSYRVYPSGGGVDKIATRINQGTGGAVAGCGCGGTAFDAGACQNNSGDLCDEWVLVGSFNSTAGTQYTLRIGNNTGENNGALKLSVDDVLIIRR